MSKFKTIRNLLLAFLFLMPVASFAQWTEVQKAWNSTAGTGTTLPTTLSLPSVGKGHVVLASAMYLGTAAFTLTMTDGHGNNFTATPNSPCTTTLGQKVWLFYFTNTPAASMTITATPSVSAGFSVHAVEFIPSAGNATFDKDACTVATTGTTPINTPSITPVRSGVLYAGTIPDPSLGLGQLSGVVGGSWTVGTNGVIASDNNDSGDEYQFSATSATAVNWTVTSSGNTGWDAMSMSMTSVISSSVVIKGKVKLKGKVKIK